jgi:hypothetical protein
MERMILLKLILEKEYEYMECIKLHNNVFFFYFINPLLVNLIAF